MLLGIILEPRASHQAGCFRELLDSGRNKYVFTPLGINLYFHDKTSPRYCMITKSVMVKQTSKTHLDQSPAAPDTSLTCNLSQPKLPNIKQTRHPCKRNVSEMDLPPTVSRPVHAYYILPHRTRQEDYNKKYDKIILNYTSIERNKRTFAMREAQCARITEFPGIIDSHLIVVAAVLRFMRIRRRDDGQIVLCRQLHEIRIR